jgi:alkylhydroperoxidase/carboxymuconolactone decarboxylase family protein YurZ
MAPTEPRDAWIGLVPRDELARQAAANPNARSLYDFGFVANMARLMRTHPRMAATWGPHFLSVMGEGGALSRQEKEMVAGVAAAAQDCHY